MKSCKKRILVIDDDAEMRSLLRDLIKDEGYEAHSVENAAEAFRKVARETFDLIITDVRMPGLSGLDILPGLKKILPDSPIILITAFGSRESYRRALERGADAYLEKPIPLDELRILMKKMISPEEKNKEVNGGEIAASHFSLKRRLFRALRNRLAIFYFGHRHLFEYRAFRFIFPPSIPSRTIKEVAVILSVLIIFTSIYFSYRWNAEKREIQALGQQVELALKQYLTTNKK